MLTQRRKTLGLAAAAIAVAGSSRAQSIAATTRADPLLQPSVHALDALHKHLATLPRRRNLKSSPMILEHRDQWDSEALDAVLHYPGGPKQSWDNIDIGGPWLNVMRNAMNAEVWSFRHPDFLCVSATHGTAQLALYDDEMWEKYELAKIAGGKITRNSFVSAPAADLDPKDFQNPAGPFSPAANSIKGLQRRGAVFLACHNAAWELSARLIAADVNPDKLTADTLCAELNNHLIAGVVMTPGSVGTLVELAKAGFAYAR
jgi:intracellular sulfur oxidation DsrE/DsrF family protein